MIFISASRQWASLPLVCTLAFALGWPPLSAQEDPLAKAQDPARRVGELDLDDLMDLKVTTPERKQSPLTGVPAAVYVIRSEDIQRTGATSVAEALRQAPGILVTRSTNNHFWSISARGFNDTLTNKLLVLMDGRFWDNEYKGKSWGVEVATNVQLASWWLLQVNYTFTRMNLTPTDDSLDQGTRNQEKQNPRNQWWVRSAVDIAAEPIGIPGTFMLDVMGRYVSSLPNFDIPQYTQVDVRLAWRDPSRSVEAAVVGQSLIRSHHAEFQNPGQRSDVERGVYGSMTVRF